ncbi:hypothetical protein A9Q84_19930 [Halobacteriovorax marinus]|uniref:SGNH hydrolase-type esterase domain-containing protein n=1 Tax=Halobacteriovorax marinus TaxID=97084 RepID=A0A1Y5F2U4_9BACT|nr:hypothetical protein A9Q84_19930 [Halobacteriovorax marinus]
MDDGLKKTTLLLLLFTLFSCKEAPLEETTTGTKREFTKEATDKEKFRTLLETLNSIPESKLVWVGDSITEQGKIGHGNDIGFTTYIEDLYPNINFVNEGIGGNTTKDIINRTASIKAHAPTVYFLAIGINDARYNDNRGATTLSEYNSNILTITNELQNSGAIVVINSIFPSFWQDASSALNITNLYQRFNEWNSKLKLIAKNKGLLFIDSFTPITSFINYTNVGKLIPDGVHPKVLGTVAKRLYAESILYDGNNTDYYEPKGNHFFKLEILNNDVDGYCAIKNITLPEGVLIKDLFGFSQNGSNYKIEEVFEGYNKIYQGFINKKNQFPLTILFSTDEFPEYISTTGQKSYLNVNRGIRSYKLSYSEDASSLENLSHNSWELISNEDSNDGVTVNLLPKTRSGIFYQLKMKTNPNVAEIKLSKLVSKTPIRFWSQNEKSSSSRHYDQIFTSGLEDDDSLVGLNYGFNLIWEVSDELNEIDIESFNQSLLGWSLKISHNPDSFANPNHESWEVLYNGYGNEFIEFE